MTVIRLIWVIQDLHKIITGDIYVVAYIEAKPGRRVFRFAPKLTWEGVGKGCIYFVPNMEKKLYLIYLNTPNIKTVQIMLLSYVRYVYRNCQLLGGGTSRYLVKPRRRHSHKVKVCPEWATCQQQIQRHSPLPLIIS